MRLFTLLSLLIALLLAVSCDKKPEGCPCTQGIFEVPKIPRYRVTYSPENCQSECYLKGDTTWIIIRHNK